MREQQSFPAELTGWVEQHLGPVTTVRDASHDRPSSRVWELEAGKGGRYYLKVSPDGESFTRENWAYRSAVPALGHSRAPQLLDCRAESLALLLTAVPGTPVKGLRMSAAEQRTVHWQAGALTARLHEAGTAGAPVHAVVEAAFHAAANAVEDHLAQAGAQMSVAEQSLVRGYAERLRHVGRVPVGLIHGDSRPRNWMWSADGRLAIIDFERARTAPVVQDLVILATSEWADHPDRMGAFFQGYGRRLTDDERVALRCLTALDAAASIAWGPAHADVFVTASGRRTLDRLMREDHHP
ncbi:phosphotransferase [Streptomyces sp. G1]|uniref:phosphotransferase enzyme family protein n=1 Tax=Streptomyces sp. G1 TaxID=361572 RepID=UPI00202F71D8|nr:phosphotransferase [Streptomyces sp. G1]MCM1974558.1 phosphotransferase [Streptomyces sp. G1]